MKVYAFIRDDGWFKSRFLQKRLEKRAAEMGAYVEAFMTMMGGAIFKRGAGGAPAFPEKAVRTA